MPCAPQLSTTMLTILHQTGSVAAMAAPLICMKWLFSMLMIAFYFATIPYAKWEIEQDFSHKSGDSPRYRATQKP